MITRTASLVCGALACAVGSSAAQNSDVVTYADHVEPILARHCVTCHSAGGSAPFSLETYQQARSMAAGIAQATTARSMPPWLPERGDVPFVGERFLSRHDIRVLRAWAEQGAPPGDVVERANPVRIEGWTLGEPDLVLELPSFELLPGPEQYRNLVVPISITETQWVQMVEVRPGNLRVVHHARLMIDTTASSRRADAADPDPGFDGMELASNAGSPRGFFVGWTPGKALTATEDGLAWRIEPGVDLVLQLHLRPSERVEFVSAKVGLHFAGGPPRRHPAVIMLGTKIIDIPPGVSDHVITDRYELPVDVDVLGLYPHAHYLAKRMEGVVKLPDGSERSIIRIPDWDFNWQDEYRLLEPMRLPTGSVLEMRYTYDNSAENPQNPSRPPRRVRYGPNSTDEMADLVVQVIPRSAGDLAVLERDLEWKYYRDEVSWLAHLEFVRGGELVERGRLDEAIDRYREALGHRADFVEAHLALGRLLAQTGHWEQALAHLRHAIQLNPDWPVPRITLARLLATHPEAQPRDREAAIEQARRATELTGGNDPRALEALALAFGAAGRVREAFDTMERAAAAAAARGEHDFAEELRDRARTFREPS